MGYGLRLKRLWARHILQTGRMASSEIEPEFVGCDTPTLRGFCGVEFQIDTAAFVISRQIEPGVQPSHDAMHF
jgi:hypothetical protein